MSLKQFGSVALAKWYCCKHFIPVVDQWWTLHFSDGGCIDIEELSVVLLATFHQPVSNLVSATSGTPSQIPSSGTDNVALRDGEPLCECKLIRLVADAASFISVASGHQVVYKSCYLCDISILLVTSWEARHHFWNHVIAQHSFRQWYMTAPGCWMNFTLGLYGFNIRIKLH